MKKIKWKSIPGYYGYYEASDTGLIKSLSRVTAWRDIKTGRIKRRKTNEKILSLSLDKKGYQKVSLLKNGVRKTYRLHRIIATLFLDNPHEKPDVNHKDGVRGNNNANNLEWCTASENQIHALRNNLSKSGENHYLSKLSNKDVLNFREEYSKGGVTFKALAQRHSVAPDTIRKAVRGLSYKHIDNP